MPVHGTYYENKTEKLPKYGSANNSWGEAQLVISVLPADEEDESELSALTVEPLDMYWANLEKDTTNL